MKVITDMSCYDDVMVMMVNNDVQEWRKARPGRSSQPRSGLHVICGQCVSIYFVLFKQKKH